MTKEAHNAYAPDGDGFTKVARKHKHRRGKHRAGDSAAVIAARKTAADLEADDSESTAPVDVIVARLAECADRLRVSDYYPVAVAAVTAVLEAEGVAVGGSDLSEGASIRIVSYGIGNFGSSPSARYQLCFLQLLAGDIGAAVDVYDPYFTNAERDTAQHMGFTVLEQDEAGKRAVAALTLFYMPHCAVELYNNLLWANWSRAGLRHLIILGNSFSDYDDNSIGGELARKAPYVDAALATVTEMAIPNTFSPEAAFNNMSVHSFRDAELTSVPAAVWADRIEPLSVCPH